MIPWHYVLNSKKDIVYYLKIENINLFSNKMEIYAFIDLILKIKSKIVYGILKLMIKMLKYVNFKKTEILLFIMKMIMLYGLQIVTIKELLNWLYKTTEMLLYTLKICNVYGQLIQMNDNSNLINSLFSILIFKI